MGIDFLHHRWPVFYADNHLLVLYKPAGLPAQGDASGDPCLLELARGWVKERYHKPGSVFLGLVHRLDRPVAGVMLFARTSKAASRLSAAFRSRRTRKRYLAILEGHLPAPSGELTHLIERHERVSRIVPAPTLVSREARLSYRVLEAAAGRSLVAVELETGRRHQIRLQVAHLGCPIVGDLRYGAPAPLPSRQIALFARELAVPHPTRGEILTFTAPLPAGWPWPGCAAEASAPLWNWIDYRLSLPIASRPGI
ncbi:MAG: RNA pseudouridine synthase [Desulfobacterales bacterium]|jgi:23S rRNA pseudouridine1911/1915/1917 synthase|nr:RNA pseudouridine synthase [Desulfobacterales bacterium]